MHLRTYSNPVSRLMTSNKMISDIPLGDSTSKFIVAYLCPEWMPWQWTSVGEAKATTSPITR